MLGDALLVAPVMREDNIGEYYLPRGTWTHLLTGEVRNEPGWHREEYGFDSLPLFVRENTLLPLGDCEDRADYDYEKNVTLRLYALCDRAQRTVCDRRGNAAFTVTAERNGNSILIRTEGGAPGLRIRLMNTPAVHNLSGAHLETEAGDVLLTACKTEIHFEF